MSFTNFQNGVSSGGALVSASHYAGLWGKNVWFVDDDGGSDTNDGKSTTKPLKLIQTAVTRAGMHDTIFLKPREIDQDTHSSHGYYTGTIIIPADRTGLAIIGTGRGAGIGSSVQCMIEPAAGATTATISVQSPSVSIENLGVKAILGSKGGIYADVAVAHAYGLAVSNCFFKDFIGAASAYGSINLITTHWVTIQHCYFKEAGTGINLSSAVAATRDPIIKDCDFVGLPATWSTPIRMAASTGMLIDNCRFDFAQPTAGTGTNKYIYNLGSTSTGMISNCFFANNTATLTTIMTLSGAELNSNCWGSSTTALT